MSNSFHVKRAAINVLTLLLLLLCLALLASSIFTNSPWYRLLLRKNRAGPNGIRTHSSPLLFANPLSFAMPSIWSSSMSLSSEKPRRGKLQPIRFEIQTLKSDDYETLEMLTLFPQNTSTRGNEFQDLTLPSLTIGNNNSNSSLLISVWTLEYVTLLLPSINFTRTVPIDKIPDDPLLAAALSFGGVYQALIDTTSANRVILSLSMWSIPFVCLASLLAFAYLMIDCMHPLLNWCNTHYNTHSSTRDLNGGLLEPLNCNPTHQQIYISKISRTPLVLGGALSGIGAACLLIGLGIWITRSFKDSKIILGAVARLFGYRATEWMQQHLEFQIDIGIVEFVATCGLLLVVSLMNLFADTDEIVVKTSSIRLINTNCDRESSALTNSTTQHTNFCIANSHQQGNSNAAYQPPLLPV